MRAWWMGLLVPASAFAAAPPAPVITWPTSGTVISSNEPDITWTGSAHDAYDLRVGWADMPEVCEGYASGMVLVDTPVFAVTVSGLRPQSTYFVYLRLHNTEGWGPWSAAGHRFYVAGEWLNTPWLVTYPLSSDSTGCQRDHSIAFRPGRQGSPSSYIVPYMIIGEPSETPGVNKDPYIGAYLLNAAGEWPPGARQITYSGGVGGAGATDATYNGTTDQFMVADRDYQAHLYGRLVNPDGSFGGALFDIETGSGVYNYDVQAGRDGYLALWQDTSTTYILARRLSSNGAPMPEGLIPIHHASVGGCGDPRIAYNPDANEYMIIFSEYTSAPQNVYACRMNAATGQLATPKILVANSPYVEWQTDIAYDTQLHRYFLTYCTFDHPQFTVWGRFIPGDLTASSTLDPPIALSDALTNGWNTRVTWNATSREFLVAWSHNVSYGIHARRISQSGALLGEPFRINGTVEGSLGNFYPIPVANAVDDDCVFCWYNSYADVYTRHYKAYPVPLPDSQPPGPVTQLTVSRYPNAVRLSWVNPSDADFSATTVRYKVGTAPAGPADGACLAEVIGPPGSVSSFSHSGLSAGQAYCYALFAHDRMSNHAPGVSTCTTLRPGDFDGDGDIDQSDFGHLQACLNEDGLVCDELCRDADLDLDGDVDSADLVSFVNCVGGPNRPPGC